MFNIAAYSNEASVRTQSLNSHAVTNNRDCEEELEHDRKKSKHKGKSLSRKWLGLVRGMRKNTS